MSEISIASMRLEMLPDKTGHRGKMALRKIFEAAFALGEGVVGGLEGFDYRQQMAVVIHQLEFDGAHLRRVAGDRQGRLGLVAA